MITDRDGGGGRSLVSVYDGPPALTWGRLVTAWEPRATVVALLVVTATIYLLAVRRLQRRGDDWAVGRSLAFVVGGLGTIAWAVLGWMGVCGSTLLCVRRAVHIAIATVAPSARKIGAT